MTKLCPRGKAAAKRKFKVYPSAYANAYASKICAGKIKDPSGVKRKDFKGPKPVRVGGMTKIEEERQKRKSDKFRRLGQSYFDTKMQEKLRKNQGRRTGTKAQRSRGLNTSDVKKLMDAMPNFKVGGHNVMGSPISVNVDGENLSNESANNYYAEFKLTDIT